MSTETGMTERLNDLQSICGSIAGHAQIDPVVARRVQEHSERVQRRLRNRGLLDVAVGLVHESREGR